MSTPYSYAAEKYCQAVQILATDGGNRQERLTRALEKVSVLEVDRLPERLRGKFASLQNLTGRRSSSVGPTIEEAISAMTDESMMRVSTLMYEMMLDLMCGPDLWKDAGAA